MQVRRHNPAGLHRNPAFSQVVTVQGVCTTVYVGGQNAVDETGAIVGEGDFPAQCAQVCVNLERALRSGGAHPTDVVSWTIYVVAGQSLDDGFSVFQERWPLRNTAPTISVIQVAGLARPGLLIEISAIAVVDDDDGHD